MTGRIKLFLENFAISFTTVMMAYVFLSSIGVWDEITGKNLAEIMLICFLVSLCHFILSLFHFSSFLLWHLLYFISMLAVVFGVGGFVLDLIDLDFTNCMVMIVLLIIVYLLVYLVAYLDHYRKAREINRLIEKNRK